MAIKIGFFHECLKTFWEKDKMLGTSIFSFPKCFQSCVTRGTFKPFPNKP